MIDKTKYKTLTFDCYGTLIDWENGILGYLQPMLQSYYVNVIDNFVLGLFAELEPKAQDEGGSYREVLGRVSQGFATRLGFTLTDDAAGGFADSIQYWQPFTDAQDALKRLKADFKLGVISNIDDDLFTQSQNLLDVDFDHVTTAEKVGVYKPNASMFEAALAMSEGPVLHVAQSRFHDILPATALGLDTVWIDRPGLSAAKRVDADPTWTFNSLTEFVDAIR
jgi:2-haloacid dehalogenase